MARSARAARAVAFAVMAAACGLLAACGMLPAAPGTAARAGGPCGPGTSTPGTLRFAIGSDDIGWLAPLIAAWNRAHPGERVLPQYLPAAEGDQLAQLTASLQAKSCFYDVIDMDVVWTAQFASSGWIIPLPAARFHLADFLQPAVATATYQGRLYGVPDYTNADLLYYRTDLVARPPATWAQLAADAERSSDPARGLQGYAATLADYEGLTVSFAEAVQSEGGSILAGQGPGATVAVDSPAALAGLSALAAGVRQGWIPREDLRFREDDAQQAFADGDFVFMVNWPDAYPVLSGPGSKVAGKFAVAPLPGMAPGVAGSSSLGGANLAVSAYSQHRQAALAFIAYLTSPAAQRAMFTQGGFPPVLTALYRDPALLARYRYLPVLGTAVAGARPRPAIASYSQASLVISSEVTAALQGQVAPRTALADMARQLAPYLSGGLAPARRGPAPAGPRPAPGGSAP